ncbi:MAG: nicotinate phosphoribosyltransferase [Thermotogae bacterium]|nr:nicotinate phosphoribosyltransferase [Thermotogota bacterium]
MRPLLTDLYELTMGNVYLKSGVDGWSAFEMSVRPHPHRNYLVSVGVLEAAREITQLRFGKEEIDYLRSLGKFSEEFLEYLQNFRFRGDIYAIPDGRIFFAKEPVMVVETTRIEGQILETMLLNRVAYQINSASKGARIYYAAEGRTLLEFGARRAADSESAVRIARATYVAGWSGTSNLEAGRLYGIPVYGTMAHAFVQTYRTEFEAFLEFAKAYPDSAIFLVDTYDTFAGIETAIEVINHLKGKLRLKGIRIDSGDLVELSRYARRRLKEAGLDDVIIVLSGDLNEWKIREIVREGEADAFGVGSEVAIPPDKPVLGVIYKLVEDEGGFKHKFSKGKVVIGGSKRLYRHYGSDGRILKDVLVHRDEENDGEPITVQVVKNGEYIYSEDSLQKARERFLRDFSTLPPEYYDLDEGVEPPVEYSPKLRLR